MIVLDSELYHGPIIAQKEVVISPTDTNDSLGIKLANLGANLLLETLPQYLAQNVTPQAQEHDQATFTQKITKGSGKIDINNPPKKETLDKMIRAYFPWPAVWFESGAKKFKLLPENKIQPEGKRPMTIKEFLNGYPVYKSKLENLFQK